MGSLLITLLILVIVFALLWYLIGILPLPAPIAGIKWILYVIVIIVAIVVLLSFIPGFNLKL